MAKVGHILQRGRHRVDSVVGMCRACVMCLNLLGVHRLGVDSNKIATSDGRGSGAWFIVIECIYIEDSDDDSNLSDDFDEIKN